MPAFRPSVLKKRTVSSLCLVLLAACSLPSDNYQYTVGEGSYQVSYNYTGENWTHADVKSIPVATTKPIAVLPIQYTANDAQPGASVEGIPVGLMWNQITQSEMARRLEALGFHVLRPTIQMYGEDWDGFQGLEHFIAGVHKGNDSVQTVLLTADAHIPSEQNPQPGAQMLVTGLHPRDFDWEQLIQKHIAEFYQDNHLQNIGARVRGGLSDQEGSAKAWHPLIERAAEYGATVAILEVAQAKQIAQKAGSVEQGRTWAAAYFDGLAKAMEIYACRRGFELSGC